MQPTTTICNFWTLVLDSEKYLTSPISHCSKSSFFVQKFNFDFPRKLSTCWVKNSWKCWGFVKIDFLDKKMTFRIVWNVNKQLLNVNKRAERVKMFQNIFWFAVQYLKIFTWYPVWMDQQEQKMPPIASTHRSSLLQRLNVQDFLTCC